MDVGQHYLEDALNEFPAAEEVRGQGHGPGE